MSTALGLVNGTPLVLRPEKTSVSPETVPEYEPMEPWPFTVSVCDW